jgi:hypothetical protein
VYVCVCVCVCVCVVKSFYILCIPLLLKKIYTKKKKIEDISPKAGYFSIWGLTDQGPSLNLGTHAYIHTHTEFVLVGKSVLGGLAAYLLAWWVSVPHTLTQRYTHTGGVLTHMHTETHAYTHTPSMQHAHPPCGSK